MDLWAKVQGGEVLSDPEMAQLFHSIDLAYYSATTPYGKQQAEKAATYAEEVLAKNIVANAESDGQGNMVINGVKVPQDSALQVAKADISHFRTKNEHISVAQIQEMRKNMEMPIVEANKITLDVSFGDGNYAVPGPLKGQLGGWKEVPGWSYAPTGAYVAKTEKDIARMFNQVQAGATVSIYAHGYEDGSGLATTFQDPKLKGRSLDIQNFQDIFSPLLDKKPKAVIFFACDAAKADNETGKSFAAHVSEYLKNTPIYATEYLQPGNHGFFTKFINGKNAGKGLIINGKPLF